MTRKSDRIRLLQALGLATLIVVAVIAGFLLLIWVLTLAGPVGFIVLVALFLVAYITSVIYRG